jgi:hypothetical protein
MVGPLSKQEVVLKNKEAVSNIKKLFWREHKAIKEE